jgi:hypothetical protein
LAECLSVSPTVANVSASRKKSDAGNFPCLLRLGSMDANEKDNRDEPKELWIHNRAWVWQWICHSPNVMKTDIFAGNEKWKSGKSTRGSFRFDSRQRNLVLSSR